MSDLIERLEHAEGYFRRVHDLYMAELQHNAVKEVKKLQARVKELERRDNKARELLGELVEAVDEQFQTLWDKEARDWLSEPPEQE